MPTFKGRALALVGGALFATSACASNTAVPAATSQLSAPFENVLVPNDTTSILKKFKKDIEIGSTVDPKNGDTGPRVISVAPSTFGLKKGQLLVCNFADSKGAAGKGTTIEVFDPKPHSKPTTFTQNAKLQGCDGDAISAGNQVYGAGLASGVVPQFTQAGKLHETYGSPIQAPLDDADAYCGFPYAPEGVYVSNSSNGAIVKLSFTEVSRGGKVKVTQVIAGFPVNKGSGLERLRPVWDSVQRDPHRHAVQRYALHRGRRQRYNRSRLQCQPTARQERDPRRAGRQKIQMYAREEHVRDAGLQRLSAQRAGRFGPAAERKPHRCEHEGREHARGVNSGGENTRYENHRHGLDRRRLRIARARDER